MVRQSSAKAPFISSNLIGASILRTLVKLRYCLFGIFLFLAIRPCFSQDSPSPDHKKPRKKIWLGRLINSSYSELAPIISPNGKLLFFTMGKDHPLNIGDDHLQDCYYSKLLPSGMWSAPKNLGLPINSIGNDAISGVSADGRTLFIKNFTYNPTSGLCFARRDSSNKWTISPITIQQYSNSNALSSQCISVNRDYIVVSIERDDSFGKLDLYVCKVIDRSKNLYGPPQNLGVIINTFEDEFAPFLAADSKTLYFSSRGQKGYGEADVYMVKRLDDSWVNWTTPKNLGEDINTTGMDAYYSLPASGSEAYFSSSNGNNHLDLYKIPLYLDERPDPVMLLEGEVMNRRGEQVHALIVATDMEQNMELSSSESSEGLGEFSLILASGRRYRLSVSSPGYLPFSTEVDLTNFSEFSDTSITLILDSVAIGSTATLEDIFFDLNQATLRPESFYSLDKLADLMKANPSWVIRIEGHTDSLGTDELNMALSAERAKAVVSYLVSKGISSDRLEAQGYGPTVPVADNATPEGRQKNRRVEFRIINFSDKK